MSNNTTIIILAFDIPSDNIKDYISFMKKIKGYGFLKLQNSLYYRTCRDRATSTRYMNRIKKEALPPGDLLMFTMSSNQFEKVQMFTNGIQKESTLSWSPFSII